MEYAVQFKVIGAIKETGRDVEVLVEAVSSNDAELQAHQLGILVSGVFQISDSTPTEAIRGPVSFTPLATPSSQPKKPDALVNLIGGLAVVVLVLSCCCGSPLLLFSGNTESTPRVKTLYEEDLERGEALAYEMAEKLGTEPPTAEEARNFGRWLANENQRRRREGSR